jgi:hypothetical protein
MVQVSIGLKQPTSPWGPPQQTHPKVRLPEPHCIKPLILLGMMGMIWHTLTTACALDTRNCTEARKSRRKSCILKVEKEFFWWLEAVESVTKKILRLWTFINAVASYKSYGTRIRACLDEFENAGKDVRHTKCLIIAGWSFCKRANVIWWGFPLAREHAIETVRKSK